MLEEREKKLVIDNIAVLMEGFRLLRENEWYIDSGTLEESERLFAIKHIMGMLFRWSRKKVLEEEDVRSVKNYFGLFLEALYLYKRKYKKKHDREVRELEGVFLKFVPYKLEAC